MSYSFNNKEEGFTIIESLVSVAIGSLLIGIALSMFNVQRKTFSVEEQLSEMQQNVRSAMDMMVREIRMAGYDPTGIGFNGISNATSGTITILLDLPDNGTVTSSSDENVTYYYDAADLQIERNGPGNPIAENITALSFSYLDGNGTVTSTLNDIRQIQIAITGKTKKADPGYGYRYGTITSSVTPKNLGL